MTEGEKAFVVAMVTKWGFGTAKSFKNMTADTEINVTGASAGQIRRLVHRYEKTVGPLPTEKFAPMKANNLLV
jgi:hypothetical protein